MPKWAARCSADCVRELERHRRADRRPPGEEVVRRAPQRPGAPCHAGTTSHARRPAPPSSTASRAWPSLPAARLMLRRGAADLVRRHRAQVSSAPSLGGADELSGYAFAICDDVGASLRGAAARGNVRVDVLYQQLPARLRGVLDCVALVALGALRRCSLTRHGYGGAGDVVGTRRAVQHAAGDAAVDPAGAVGRWAGPGSASCCR